ncbi:DUF4192 domain-containing protein [Acidipropionibacterium timonense]|uniref:DUF4192 domain-containing protein n=1 Tax=Acidipropionibacterium timonense TaxID=2161818 RepID=UPI0010322AAF|nr:DUF4192 domain-containing protein [Acidipropionibacterium timonense]
MRNTTHSPLHIRSVDDVITVLPHLLGFRPTDSLVVMIVGPRTCPAAGLVARMDLPAMASPEGFRAGVGSLEACHPGTDLLFVVFTDDIPTGQQVLREGLSSLRCSRVLDAVVTDGSSWWGIDEEEGHPVVDDGRAAAEAIYRGLSVLPDRAALARTVAGPGPEPRPEDAELFDESWRMLREMTLPDLFDLADTLLAAPTMEEDEPGPHPAGIDALTAVHLARMLELPMIQIALWQGTERADARRLVDLWKQVLHHCPDHLAGPVLGLCGLAAWLCGDGATTSVCLERGGELECIDALLLGALDVVHRSMLPPEAWDALERDPYVIVETAPVARDGAA